MSADEQIVVVDEGVRGNFEVERRRPLVNSARCVELRAVAGTKEASWHDPGIGQGHAAQVRANPDQDHPLSSLISLLARRRIPKQTRIYRLLLLDYRLGTRNIYQIVIFLLLLRLRFIPSRILGLL